MDGYRMTIRHDGWTSGSGHIVRTGKASKLLLLAKAQSLDPE
jgi:hypothetical protein